MVACRVQPLSQEFLWIACWTQHTTTASSRTQPTVAASQTMVSKINAAQPDLTSRLLFFGWPPFALENATGTAGGERMNYRDRFVGSTIKNQHRLTD